MGDPLPPDPYQALGVAKDATAAAIKTQYRKLVLKCHPDKVKDETAKQEASDKFHKIQSAWEIIGDEARRARYDAQVKLQELRKDVFAHGGEGRRAGGGGGDRERERGGPDVRTASYKMPTDSARGGDFYARGPERYGPKVSPQYEERKPSYAADDYFEERGSRPSSRKYDEYERTTKRAPPKEERERARKENERTNRKEKSRRTDKDVRRERDRKQAYVEVEEEYTSDEYGRARRTPPDDPALNRARAEFFQSPDPFARDREPEGGNYERSYFEDKFDAARAYIDSSRAGGARPEPVRKESTSREPERREARPPPVRMSSSKDKVKAKGGFFGVRHGSGDRPKSSKSAKPEKEAKSSDEDRRETRRRAEDPRSSKKTPPLTHSKSTPPEVRPSATRQRSHSMQEDDHYDEPPIPTMKRSETMPQAPSGGAAQQRDSRRREPSRLHPEAAYPSPGATPEPETSKYRYGMEYADDDEFPTPDGYNVRPEPYQTQVHAPTRGTGRETTRDLPKGARYTRSPSPMKQEERQQSRRTSSARHPTTAQRPSNARTTSTSYMVDTSADGKMSSRPVPSRENSTREPPLRTLSRENSGRGETLYRENSGRAEPLYRELPRQSGVRTGSPRQGYMFQPPSDGVQYADQYTRADVRQQSGFQTTSSQRRGSEKPAQPARTPSGLHRQQPMVY